MRKLSTDRSAPARPALRVLVLAVFLGLFCAAPPAAEAAATGIALEVAGWVPPRDSTYGGWGVVASGATIETPLAWTKADSMLELPPGSYDVYWVQDYDKRDRPMLLAAGVSVAADELTVVKADSGIALTVASWVPARHKEYGWWGAVRSGDPPDERLNWTKSAGAILLPPGRYDLYWVQDYDTRSQPLLLAAGVSVAPGEKVALTADSGVELAVAPWVPARDKEYGWWGAVKAGDPADARLNWSKASDRLLLPPGGYDFYWAQDYATRDNPLPLATGVRIDKGQLARIAADSGIELAVASWVPMRDEDYGWWGAVQAGAPADERTNWTNHADSLLLPPGSYDVYWAQDYATRDRPMAIAADVAVEAGDLVRLKANSGGRIIVANWVPPLDQDYGWWGAVQAGDAADERVNWTKTAAALLLPPGNYDIYWAQNYQTRDHPVALASVLVQPGEFGGVGLELAESSDGIVVVRALRRGPAESAGILAGDIVDAVQGEALKGKSLAEAVQRLRGEAGSKVMLTIRRQGIAEPFDVVLERSVVAAPPTVVRVGTGIKAIVAPGVTPLDRDSGWWGVVVAGASSDERVSWSKGESAAPLVLPPGTYDLWWRTASSEAPQFKAAGIVVTAGALVEVPIGAAAAEPAAPSAEGEDAAAGSEWAIVQSVTAGAPDLADDFSDPTSGWPVLETPEASVGYAGGVYRMVLTSKGELVQAAFVDWNVGDGIVQVDASDTSGSFAHPFGLFVRVQDDNNHHFFIIASDGSYAMLRRQNGRPALDAYGALPTGAYRKDAPNRIQAFLRGEEIVYFVNGLEADRTTALWPAGSVGLLSVNQAAGTSSVSFDDMKVWLAGPD
jgi:hypothetical protein